MPKSKIFSLYCLIFILSIAVRSYLDIDLIYPFIILLAGIVTAIIYWHHPNKSIKFIALSGVFLFLGFWRLDLAHPSINQNHISHYNNQSTEFIGQVVAESDIRFDKTKLVIGHINNYKGKVLVNLPNYPVYHYADWLRINCHLETPGQINDFDYGRYLSVQDIYSVCYNPDSVALSYDQPNTLTIWQRFRLNLINLKQKSKQIINSTISFPHSEVLSAITLGLRRQIPADVTDSFSRAGLSHIIAISGLHISIIGMLLMNFLIAIYFKRKHAFWLASILMILFLLLIGFRASAVRAGIMGFLAMYALASGRLKDSINSLLFAAVILLTINPKLLVYDIGFQLSFLAVFGIIYLYDYFDHFFDKIKIPEFFQIRSSLAMTLSAQVLVLPLIVYYFGNLSLAAPLANILVLPLLPFVMIGGFVLMLAGLIFLPLAQIIGYLLTLGLGYILYISRTLSHFPGTNFDLNKIDFAWILIIYMLLIWGIWLIKQKAKTI